MATGFICTGLLNELGLVSLQGCSHYSDQSLYWIPKGLVDRDWWPIGCICPSIPPNYEICVLIWGPEQLKRERSAPDGTLHSIGVRKVLSGMLLPEIPNSTFSLKTKNSLMSSATQCKQKLIHLQNLNMSPDPYQSLLIASKEDLIILKSNCLQGW